MCFAGTSGRVSEFLAFADAENYHYGQLAEILNLFPV